MIALITIEYRVPLDQPGAIELTQEEIDAWLDREGVLPPATPEQNAAVRTQVDRFVNDAHQWGMSHGAESVRTL